MDNQNNIVWIIKTTVYE